MDEPTKILISCLLDTVKQLLDEVEPVEMGEDPDEYILSADTVQDLKSDYLALNRAMGREQKYKKPF